MARIKCGRGSGKLNRLPPSVINNILRHLPLKDAARTSVLSLIWRRRWRRLSQLVFDDTFYTQVIRKKGTDDSTLILMTIYKVLLLHRGPVRKFTLSLSELESNHHIDELIIYVSKKGIQDLTLHIWKGEPYKLPLSVHSLVDLRHLNLCFCVFETPHDFHGFKNLISLELRDVVIEDDTLCHLISCCPLLEELRLNFSASLQCLAIFAPNLRYLLCEGHFCRVSLQYTPRLATCRVYLTEEVFRERGRSSKPLFEEGPSRAVMFFGDLPVLEFLELDYFYVKYIVEEGVPPRFPTTLNHLKVIKLHSICFEELDEVLLVLCVLRSSLNLELFRLQAFVGETSSLSSFIALEEIKESSDICLDTLQEVEIQNVSGREGEMEFIRLLLAVSPNLKRMVVGSNAEKVTDNGLGILKELTRFCRASTVAEVVYKQPDELPPF